MYPRKAYAYTKVLLISSYLKMDETSCLNVQVTGFAENCRPKGIWGGIFSPPCYPHTMQITVQLPDDLVQHPNPGREALESLAIEGLPRGTLSHFQASQVLDLSRFEFDGFLKERHIRRHAYDVEDLDEDRETLRELQAKGFSGQ